MPLKENPNYPAQTPVNPPIRPHWCLLDHPEFWRNTIPKGNGTELLSEAIFRSKRLSKLSNSQKNEITSFPSDSVIKPYLTCSICSEIPFLRKRNTKKLKTGDAYPYTVYLCENGHPVCRSCAQSFKTCMFEKPYMDSTLKEWSDCNPESMSMTTWSSKRLCNAPIDKTENEHDFFLADVIEATQFRCAYYYEKVCRFVGNGKGLHDHESTHVQHPSELERVDSGDNEDHGTWEDARILSYDHSKAVESANEIIGEVLVANLSQIDLSSVPSSVLTRHIV